MTEEKRKDDILKQYKDLPKGVVKYIDFLIAKINKLVSENNRVAQHILELLKDKGDLTDKIADIKANCDLAIEGRDLKIMELEQEVKYQTEDSKKWQNMYKQRCEECQKLTKEFEEGNNKLLDVINNQDVKIADLEKENAELTERLEDLQEQNSEMFNTIALQEQQIEKMKCCANCNHKKSEVDRCELLMYTMNACICKNKDKWELRR